MKLEFSTPPSNPWINQISFLDNEGEIILNWIDHGITEYSRRLMCKNSFYREGNWEFEKMMCPLNAQFNEGVNSLYLKSGENSETGLLKFQISPRGGQLVSVIEYLVCKSIPPPRPKSSSVLLTGPKGIRHSEWEFSQKQTRGKKDLHGS